MMQARAIVQTSLSQLYTQVFVWQQETNNNVDFMAQTMNNRVHQKQSNKYMYVCIRFWVVSVSGLLCICVHGTFCVFHPKFYYKADLNPTLLPRYTHRPYPARPSVLGLGWRLPQSAMYVPLKTFCANKCVYTRGCGQSGTIGPPRLLRGMLM